MEVSKKELLALMLCKASYHGSPWNVYLPDQWSKYQGQQGSPSLRDYIVEQRIEELSKYKRDSGLMRFVLGRLQTEATLMLAFRGSYSPRDGLTDMHQNPATWEEMQPLLNRPGRWEDIKFHKGFLDRCRGRQWEFPNFPRNFLVHFVNNGGKVVITGHSMGGAVAAILTLGVMADLCRLGKSPAYLLEHVQCITFGAPAFCSSELHHELIDRNLLHVFSHFMHESDLVPIVYRGLTSGLKKTWVYHGLKYFDLHDHLLPEYVTPGDHTLLSKRWMSNPDYMCPPFFTTGNGPWYEEAARELGEVSVIHNVISPHFLYSYTPLVFRYVYTKALAHDRNREQCPSLYAFLTS